MSSIKSSAAVFVVRAIGLLPLPACRAVGWFIGRSNDWFNSRGAKVTRANLALCMPHLSPNERERLARQSMIETGKVATETCFIMRNTQLAVTEFINNIEGEDLARAALEQGKGLIILAPHLGNWEVLGLNLTKLAEVTNLYQPPKIAALDVLIRTAREMSGATLVPTTAKGVAALLKSLQNNGISGILPDQNPNDENAGIYSEFFGHPAFTMTLINKLMRRTGCRALFAFAKRTPKGFDLIYREPPLDIYSDDANVAVAALNKGIENLVLEAPEQYQWEYKRFRKVPAGHADVYQGY